LFASLCSESGQPQRDLMGRSCHCAREAHLPDKYIPELREATRKAGLDWDKFLVTDNSCPPHPPRKNPIQELGDDIVAVRVLTHNNVRTPVTSLPTYKARIASSKHGRVELMTAGV